MEYADHQPLQVTELIKALEEELEILSIPEDEKDLLVRYMVQDILQREGYQFISTPKTTIEPRATKAVKETRRKNKKIVLH